MRLLLVTLSICGFMISAAAQDTTMLYQMLQKLQTLSDTDPSAAIVLCQEGLRKGEEQNFHKYDGKFNGYLGILYQGLGAYDKSSQFLKLSMDQATQTGDHRARITAGINLGGNYFYQGKHQEALDWFIRMEKEAQKSKDLSLLASIDGNIAAIYIETGRIKDAFPYYHRAAIRFIHAGDSAGLGRCYQNMGPLKFGINEKDSGIYFLQSALKISQAMGTRSTTGRIYMDYAEMFAKHGQRQKAEEYFLRATRELEDMKDLNQWIQALCLRAENQSAMGQYNSALKNGQKAYELAISTKSNHWLNMAAECLEKIYSRNGDYKNAYTYAVKAAQYRDSLLTESRTRELQNATIAFETEKREQEITRLNSENNYRTRMMYLGIFAAIFILLTAGIIVYIVQKNKRRTENLNLALRQSNAVKDKMFGVLSHDLRSPLSRLHSYFLLSEKKLLSPEQTAEIREKLNHSLNESSQLLDSLLLWAGKQRAGFSFKREKVYLKPVIENCLSLYRDFYTARDIQIEVLCNDDDAVTSDPNLVQLVMRNLIVNAIRFTPNGARIEIKGETDQFTVTDGGQGVSAEWLEKINQGKDGQKQESTEGVSGEKGNGMGLQLCQELLMMQGGKIIAENLIHGGARFSVTFSRD